MSERVPVASHGWYRPPSAHGLNARSVEYEQSSKPCSITTDRLIKSHLAYLATPQSPRFTPPRPPWPSQRWTKGWTRQPIVTRSLSLTRYFACPREESDHQNGTSVASRPVRVRASAGGRPQSVRHISIASMVTCSPLPSPATNSPPAGPVSVSVNGWP